MSDTPIYDQLKQEWPDIVFERKKASFRKAGQQFGRAFEVIREFGKGVSEANGHTS